MNQIKYLGDIYIDMSSSEVSALFINPNKAGRCELYFTIFESFVKQIFLPFYS